MVTIAEPQITRPLRPALDETPHRLTTYRDLPAIIDELKRSGEPLGLDIETSGLNPRQDRMLLVQFGTPACVYILDVRGDRGQHRRELREGLQAIIDNAPYIVGQNLAFDLAWLQTVFGVRAVRVHDTMLQAQILASRQWSATRQRLHFGLADVAGHYGLAVEKETRESFFELGEDAELTPAMLRYAAQDIAAVCLIDALQWPELTAAELAETAALENAAVPAMVRLAVSGMAVDRAGWTSYIDQKQKAAAIAEAEVQAALLPAMRDRYQREDEDYAVALEAWTLAYGHMTEEARRTHAITPSPKPSWKDHKLAVQRAWRAEHPKPIAPAHQKLRDKATGDYTAVNLGSWQQVQAALALQGIDVSDTREETLAPLAGESPIIARFLDWRRHSKIVGTYGAPILERIEADGRIYPDYYQIGTETGRMSARNPAIQTIPSREAGDIRQHFIAEPGNKLVLSDFSQIETRILADQSGDPALLDFFARGLDIHSETARLVFALGPDVDPKRAEYRPGIPYRAIAKTINYGLAYGLSAPGLAMQLGISLDQADGFIARYFAQFPSIRAYLDESAERAVRTGEARSLAGRRRLFDLPSPQHPDYSSQMGGIRREAKNHPIQAANADILKLALVLLDRELPATVRIVAVVHDEIICEAPEAEAKHAGEILGRCMHQAARAYLRRVALPEPEVAIGDSWAVKG